MGMICHIVFGEAMIALKSITVFWNLTTIIRCNITRAVTQKSRKGALYSENGANVLLVDKRDIYL